MISRLEMLRANYSTELSKNAYRIYNRARLSTTYLWQTVELYLSEEKLDEKVTEQYTYFIELLIANSAESSIIIFAALSLLSFVSDEIKAVLPHSNPFLLVEKPLVNTFLNENEFEKINLATIDKQRITDFAKRNMKKWRITPRLLLNILDESNCLRLSADLGFDFVKNKQHHILERNVRRALVKSDWFTEMLDHSVTFLLKRTYKNLKEMNDVANHLNELKWLFEMYPSAKATDIPSFNLQAVLGHCDISYTYTLVLLNIINVNCPSLITSIRRQWDEVMFEEKRFYKPTEAEGFALINYFENIYALDYLACTELKESAENTTTYTHFKASVTLEYIFDVHSQLLKDVEEQEAQHKIHLDFNTKFTSVISNLNAVLIEQKAAAKTWRGLGISQDLKRVLDDKYDEYDNFVYASREKLDARLAVRMERIATQVSASNKGLSDVKVEVNKQKDKISVSALIASKNPQKSSKALKPATDGNINNLDTGNSRITNDML